MTFDVHAPYVQELFRDGDWGGLLRYGLAHGLHMSAIDAALRVLNSERFGTDFATLRE